MESFCLDNIWKVGVLLLLVSHVASKDPRRPASVLRSDSSQGRSESEDTVMENLSCASVNLESLVCRWETPKIPVSNYTMYLYNWLHLWDIKQSCTCYEEWCNSCPGVCCHWKAPAYDFTAPEIMIELSTGSNARNETFNQSLIVLPGEAEKLSISTTESYQELEVRWDTPKFLLNFDPGLFYSVDYRPKNVSVFGSLDWMSVAGHYCDKSATVRLTSLHGWVDYEVRVRLRSGARPPPDDDDDDRWWSSVASEAVTSQGAPEVAPAVGVGTFEVESDADSGRRAVALQWRPVPPLLHNGPGLEYRVLVRDQTNNTVKDLTETGTFVRIEDLNKDTSYRMEITAANHVGVGHTTPAVRIPAAPPPAPLLPAVVYHTGTRHYELWWPAKENLTYTAYVCTDGLSFLSPCTSNLYWKNLGSASAVNLTLEELNVTDSLTPDKVRFALSAETFAEDSSGMAWDSCVHPQQYNTQHSAPEIFPDYDSTMNSVSLRWSADCVARGGVIEEVQAIWCEGHGSCDDAGNETPMKNESDVFSGVVVLDGLREGSDYAANLRLKYRGGFSGWSSPLLFSTKSSVLPTWLIVIIVIAAVAVTVVVLAAGVYSRRRIEVMVREVRREIHLPEGLDDHHFPSGKAGEIDVDVPLRPIDVGDSQSNKNVYVVSSQVLPVDKTHLQSPSSGDRSRAQNNTEERKLFAQNGYVLPMFTTDVSDDGQGSVHETNYIPVFTSLPSGHVENCYEGLKDPNPSYVAIVPPNSNVCKSSSMNINTDEEGNTHAQIWQDSEGIMDKDERGASPGYVVFPTKESRDSGVVMDKGDQGKSSIGYASLQVVGLDTQIFQTLKENTDRDGKGISTNFVAFPAADFTTQISHGLRENSVRDEQGKSSGYITLPAANFVMQTSNCSGENSDKDEQGKSSGYITLPAANSVMQTSSGSGENSDRDEQGKSSGYITIPAANFVMQTSNCSGENSVRDEQENSTGYIFSTH